MNDFEARVAAVDPAALHATAIEVLQLNLGPRCNMRCEHCHQAGSPERSESMTEEVLAASLALARRLRPHLVDVTGGAPELHPRLRELVAALRDAGLEVQLRTNLTALLDPGCQDLPERWAGLGVRLLASLPSWDPEVTARQRGRAAMDQSLRVLLRLNQLGFGMGRLRLDLAANPDGPRLPEPTARLESRFRHELGRHGVRFDSLAVLTNVPVGRLAATLGSAGRRAYLEALRGAFNPTTVPRLACRRTLCVGWDGRLYDCDFNLGAGLAVVGGRTVHDFDDGLIGRRLALAPHCYACTAQAGSS